MCRIIKLFLAIALLATPVLADTFGEWTYSVANGEATITGYSGSGGAVVIPSEVNGIPVRQVGNGSRPIFGYSNTSVTSITIPDSVTSIGKYAFSGCNSLTSITIPDSVTSIGESAFGICTSLTSITIPDSVTSIRDFTFGGCNSLTSITIPSSVTSIGYMAFASCISLTSITIPSSVTSIGIQAFELCISLTSITIPNSVTSIGAYAFWANNLVTAFLPARFATTYQSFSLTPEQVILYDESNLAGIYLAGQQSVIANPNTHNLYTTSQIQNMAIGDLVLTRTNNGSFVLNYDIEQSEDLQNWTPYQGFAMALTNLPTNKAFVRIKAKQ